jgi:hypothetical protein
MLLISSRSLCKFWDCIPEWGHWGQQLTANGNAIGFMNYSLTNASKCNIHVSRPSS